MTRLTLDFVYEKKTVVYLYPPKKDEEEAQLNVEK